MQGFCRQGIPVDVKPATEFGCQVLSIGRTATVSAEQYFIASPKSIGYHVNRLCDAVEHGLILQQG
jgi:hypothetical protein